MAGIQAIVVFFVLLGIMGSWDGLVRRHIRLSYDVLRMYFFLSGVPAVLIGIVSALITISFVRAEVIEIRATDAICSTAACTIQRIVLAPFTSWQTTILVLLPFAAFVYWILGAFDLHGPYRRRMLAPHIWYQEKRVVALVRYELQEHHLPSTDDDTIIRTARTVIFSIPTYKSLAPNSLLESGHLDPNALAKIYVSGNTTRNDRGTSKKEAQTRMVVTILRYYLDLHERAVEKWPWRKKLLRY